MDPSNWLTLSSPYLPILILITSLGGSWHCAGMCGPIACSPDIKSHPNPYHFGRGIIYTLIGFISGFGSQVLGQIQMIANIQGLLMSTILLLMGIGLIVNWKIPLPQFNKYLFGLLRKAKHNSWAMGLLTGLLPCGWLYSFVLLAFTSRSPLMGAMIMFCFWVGTIPALSSLQFGIQRLTFLSHQKLKRITGLIIIAAALYSVIQHHYFHSHLTH